MSRSTVIQTVPLGSLKETVVPSESSAGLPFTKAAGTPMADPTFAPRSCFFQPSGSVPANGSAITRYAATAAATTPAPTPSHALRPSRIPRVTICAGWVGAGAGGFAISDSTSRIRAAVGRLAGSFCSRPVISSASGPGAEAGGAGVALRTDWSVAGVLLRRNGETPSVAA